MVCNDVEWGLEGALTVWKWILNNRRLKNSITADI